jgi:serine/threonine-protein kinase
MTSASQPKLSALPVITAPADHERLKMLFAEVCDLPQDARAVVLDRLQATAAEREAVARLIAKDDAAIDRPGAAGADTTTRPPLATPVAAMLASMTKPVLGARDLAGLRVGAWTVTEKIGQGGMGAVYRAERHDGQFQQTVAIKFLKGWATPQAIARLAEERQTLAALEHPNIARLIDGGATADGAPYLVMDFVNGVSITDYCKQRRTGLIELARLMAAVCEAVSYAHQSLTLHCDLKPANILIDAAGRPKLLDFGIAELIGAASATANSAARDAAFTPRYASPEQRTGAKLSTATDVYSLGKVLDELLSNADATPRNIRQDLAAIAAKACAELIAARYASAGAMRADLERLVRHEPVLAANGGFAYRTRKLVERRWGMALALSALVIGSAAFTTSLVRERDRALRAEAMAETELARAIAAEDTARAERDRAQVSELRANEREQEAVVARSAALSDRDRALRAEANSQREALRALRAEGQTQLEAANTRETRDFLFSLFNSIDPNRGGGPQMTAVDLLARGRERVATLPPEQRELKASLMQILGRIYENIGLMPEARSLYRDVAALYADPANGNPAKHADVLGRIAVVENNVGNAAAGEGPARESYAIRQRLFSAESAEVADAENTLGLVLSGLSKYEEASQMLSSALAKREKLFGPKNEEVASTLHNLGIHYSRFSQPALAESAYRRSLAIKYELFGKRHPKVLNTLERLAAQLGQQRRFAEAEPMVAEAYQTRVELHGMQSEYVASAANEWASILHDMGRYRDAERLYLEAINSPARATVDAKGVRSVTYAVSVNNLANLYEEIGSLASAERGYRTSLEVRRARMAADDLSVARAEQNLGRALAKLGNAVEADKLLAHAYQVRLAKLGAKHPDVHDSAIARAEIAAALGKKADASVLLAGLDEGVIAARPQRWLAKRRIDALLATGENSVAIYDERVRYARERFGATHLVTMRAQLDHAEALAAGGKNTEAARIGAVLEQPLDAVLAPSAPERARLAALRKVTTDAP